MFFDKRFYKIFFFFMLFSVCFVRNDPAAFDLASARENLKNGDLEKSLDKMSDIPASKTSKVLYLMERGTISHYMSDFVSSNNDFFDALNLIKDFETYSVSRGMGSLVTNDNILLFKGYNFEHVYVYNFLAMNHLALSNWDYAAISARNIINLQNDKKNNSGDAFSRYIAGLSLLLIHDYGNAKKQFKIASKLLKNIEITDMGYIKAKHNKKGIPEVYEQSGNTLICFISIGNSPSLNDIRNGFSQTDFKNASFAEIYCDNKRLGRSFPLSNIGDLRYQSFNKTRFKKATKSLFRIILKAAFLVLLEHKQNGLGQSLDDQILNTEIPDTRAWETLPSWFQVASVPCHENMKNFEIVFKSSDNTEISRKSIAKPLSRKGRLLISICRDFS